LQVCGRRPDRHSPPRGLRRQRPRGRSVRIQGAPLARRRDGSRRGTHRIPKGTSRSMTRTTAPLKLAFAAALFGLQAAHAQVASDARSGPDPELRLVLLEAVADVNSFRDRFDAEVWLTDMSARL